ncbi:MAG: hypothetical protein HY423_05100 [Candidatus Lambdaproteobacteria bacterium]|nr:hypothetical protein [Candidatus Lambdaproteobacteria bacterium]
MRRSRRTAPQLLGLDSLVDIVSNNLGILIILAVFTSLLALMNPGQALRPVRPAPVLEPPPAKILIPWSHPTTKSTVFAALTHGRVVLFDLRAFYRELGRKPSGSRPEPMTIEEQDFTVRFFPVTTQIFCLEFRPRAGAGENLAALQHAGSRWRQFRARYAKEKFVYFFWVAGDSFELFRYVRRDLWREQVEVGWKPLAPNGALELCNGFEGSTGFQPQ